MLHNNSTKFSTKPKTKLFKLLEGATRLPLFTLSPDRVIIIRPGDQGDQGDWVQLPLIGGIE